MHHLWVRRVITGIAAAALAAAAATPAYAAAPAIRVVVHDTTVAAGASTHIAPNVYADSEIAVSGASVTYELSGGLDGVTLTDPSSNLDCSGSTPTKLTCAIPWEALIDTWGISDDLTVTLRAGDGATAGETGTIAVTFAGDGITPVTQTAKVEVAEGVDLAAGPSLTVNAKPGDAVDADLSVRNNSGKTAHGVGLVLYTDYPLKATTEYSNCLYARDRPTLCTFDEDLRAGSTYAVALPYRLRPDTYAPGSPSSEFEWLTPGDLQDLLAASGTRDFGVPGSGGVLALTERPAVKSLAKQTDTDPDNNGQVLTVNAQGKQGTDLAAVGATLTGGAGATVTAEVGVHNNGPATLDFSRADEPAAAVIVTPPAGTTVTTIPAGCAKATDGSEQTKPGTLQYACYSSPLLPAGASVVWKFGFTITAAVTDGVGAVEVNPTCACDRFNADKSTPAFGFTIILVVS